MGVHTGIAGETAAASGQVATLIATRRINLDASANAAVTPGVAAAVMDAMTADYGNPSSGHQAGEAARIVLERVRDAVVLLLDGAQEDGVTFTSGCTEANNLVLLGAFSGRTATLISTQVEHPSILRPAARLADHGVDVRLLPVDRDGRIDLDRLASHLREATGPVLVSVQAANSETGAMQDLAAIAELVASRSETLFHSDCAQAFAKHRIALGDGVGPHALSLSGHKINAPMGSGALVVGAGVELALEPLILGGDQEGGARAGTQALPALAGLGFACSEWRAAGPSAWTRMQELRDLLEEHILHSIPDARINGSAAPRLPNITSLTLPGLDGMALVAQLDAHGIAVSQGSACSSRRPEPSHVLTAMGLSEADAFSTIRLSISIATTRDEIEEAISVLGHVSRRLRRFA